MAILRYHDPNVGCLSLTVLRTATVHMSYRYPTVYPPVFRLDPSALTPVIRPARGDRRWWIGVPSAVIVFGIVIRLVAFYHHRALGIDEVMLALNLTARSFGGLLHPLAFEQTAPILFLWLSKASIAAVGIGERALRAGPFIAGVVLAPLVWYAARRLLSSPEGAALAAASVAVCPIAMAYADILKPYAVDATVTALLLGLTLRVIGTPLSRAIWCSLGVACSLGVFLSAPSVFVTAAALAAIAISPAGRIEGVRRRLAAVTAAWAACGGVNFVALQRSTVQNTYMQRYWEGAFFRPPLSHMATLAYGRVGWTVQEMFLGEGVAYPSIVRLLFVAVAIAGLFALLRRQGRWAIVLLAGPIVFAVVASGLRLYPLSERTLLFAAPVVLITVASGVEALAAAGARRIPSIGSPLFASLAALLLLPATVDSAMRVHDLLTPDAFRAAMVDLTQHARPSAPIYVFSRDVPIWTFYTTDWANPDTARVRRLVDVAASAGPNSGNMPSRGHPVADEGRDLVVQTGQRVELIGVPTGIQARFADVSQQAPDPGWATNEANRIHTAANPDIWLFFTYCHNMCDSTLIDTLTADGGRVTYKRIVRGARIYEYRRDSTTRSN